MVRLRPETQKSIAAFFGNDKTPDEVMHEFLDEVKDLEVAWFTSDDLEEVAEGFARVACALMCAADGVDISVQAEVDVYMRDLRKEAE